LALKSRIVPPPRM